MNPIKRLFFIFLAVPCALMVGCASSSKQESTGEYVDDSVITTRVKAAIVDDSALKVSEIKVETFKGRVQLSGFVTSRDELDHAVEVVRKVKGVKAVVNDMHVK